MKKELKSEILPLINSLICHKIYFSSFTERPEPSKKIKELYISEPSFLYGIFERGRELRDGFLLIGADRGVPWVKVYRDFYRCIPEGACLAIDLCEHAYFLDYRFENEKYLSSMLRFLDTGRIFSEKIGENYLDSQI